MSKKNEITVAKFDEFKQELKQEQLDRWSKTTNISAKIRVKIIDREPNLWDRIKQRVYKALLCPRILLCSQDSLVSVLDNDYCRFLAVANSIDTYMLHPQQGIQIESTHQELSARECIGLVVAYHKGQPISQVQWHLTLSDGIAILSAEAPLPLYGPLTRSLPDQIMWTLTP